MAISGQTMRALQSSLQDPGAGLEVTQWLNAAAVELTEATTTIATNGAGTLTAAALLGGTIVRTTATSNFTDTTDTGALIFAALPSSYQTNQGWLVWINNQTGVQQTLSAATGVTLAGVSSIIAANCTAACTMVYNGNQTFTLNVLGVSFNAAGGYDPSTVITQFGSSTATFGEEGNVYKMVSQTGVAPGATGAHNVIGVYSLPANAFDGIGNRGLYIQAVGTFANNGNTKQIRIYFGCTTAVLGSTVTGGTVICDTGSYSTAAQTLFNIAASVFKYGAANSNTQQGVAEQVILGGVHSGAGTSGGTGPVALTATENATILIAVTGNAGTTASDIILQRMSINVMN